MTTLDINELTPLPGNPGLADEYEVRTAAGTFKVTGTQIRDAYAAVTSSLTAALPAIGDQVAFSQGGNSRRAAVEDLDPLSDPERTINYLFRYYDMGGSSGMGISVVGTTGTVSRSTPVAATRWGNVGLARLQRGTTAGFLATIAVGCHVLPGDRRWILRNDVWVPTNLSDGTNRFRIEALLANSLASQTDGIGIRQVDDVNGGRFQGFAMAASTESVSDIGLAILAGKRYLMETEINAAATQVLCRVRNATDGGAWVQGPAITTNITSTVAMSPRIVLRGQLGTTDREFLTSHVWLRGL